MRGKRWADEFRGPGRLGHRADIGRRCQGFIAYRMTVAMHGSTLTPVQYPGTVRSKPAPAEANDTEPAVAKRIPEKLPDVDMPDTKGVPHKLSEWQGQPLMVNFWATWCDPCRRESPLLKQLRRRALGRVARDRRNRGRLQRCRSKITLARSASIILYSLAKKTASARSTPSVRWMRSSRSRYSPTRRAGS